MFIIFSAEISKFISVRWYFVYNDQSGQYLYFFVNFYYEGF